METRNSSWKICCHSVGVSRWQAGHTVRAQMQVAQLLLRAREALIKGGAMTVVDRPSWSNWILYIRTHLTVLTFCFFSSTDSKLPPSTVQKNMLLLSLLSSIHTARITAQYSAAQYGAVLRAVSVALYCYWSIFQYPTTVVLLYGVALSHTATKADVNDLNDSSTVTTRKSRQYILLSLIHIWRCRRRG